jgi:hypothetical protein
MTGLSLIDAATQWVMANYPYNSFHLVKSLEWLDRIAPGSREAVRLAALTHDMERAFLGPDQPQLPKALDDPEYNRLHAERSARIVRKWLCENGAAHGLVAEVELLVRAHELGGWPEANLVQAADSLSFLETNINLFLGFVKSGRYSPSDVRRKFEYSYERIRLERARALARPLFESAIARLEIQQAARSAEGL